MASGLTARQLTGQDESHLVTLADGQRLQADAAVAFEALRADARAAGFELAIASAYRSYARQLAIWNGKVAGERPVHDDAGDPVRLAGLSDARKLDAILRFSAIPGTSRHHWGTDLDVYDAGAVPADYRLQLSPVEVAPGGVFDALHCWLDEVIAAGCGHGFFRPYDRDRGGVAPERWHLSFAPLSAACAADCRDEVYRAAWDADPAQPALLLRRAIEADWPALRRRYIEVPERGPASS
ncbi:MAG: peptidase [Halioglobus sp.]|nr:peptidase [Halioglobus sp.]